jgi:phage FluMu protein Com
MSSGEADTFSIKITGEYPEPVQRHGDWTSSMTTTTEWSPTYWYNYNWATSIYYYQITCPKCKTLNWAEVDKIVACKGTTQARNNRVVSCGAKLKAVLDTVDYEIPVTKP